MVGTGGSSTDQPFGYPSRGIVAVECGPVLFSDQKSDCVAWSSVPANALPKSLAGERQLIDGKHGVALCNTGMNGGRFRAFDQISIQLKRRLYLVAEIEIANGR